MYCFIDLDGVLVDFVAGVCKAHNRPNPYLDSANLGIFDMEKIWNISPVEFYRYTNSFNFWYGLNPTPEANDIVKLCVDKFGKDNLAILTSPSIDPGCVPGKRSWVQKYFPELAKVIIFTGAKKFLGGPGRVLVDDRDKNIDSFVSSGGIGLTVPRSWNHLYPSANNCVSHLQNELNGIHT